MNAQKINYDKLFKLIDKNNNSFFSDEDLQSFLAS